MKKRSVGIMIAALAMAGLALASCIGPGSNSEIVRPDGEAQFPPLKGIDLLGESRQLPDTFAGELNIVAVAFRQEQQEAVNSWIPVAEDLMQRYDGLRFYEIPLIYEMTALGRAWVNNGMRSGILDNIARERTITVYTDRDAFWEIMDMQESEISLLLVDDRGQILWRHDGVADEEAIAALRRQVAERL